MRRLNAMRIWMLLSLMAFTLCTLMGGCISAGLKEQSDKELLPWNEPADWERTTLGAPF